MAEWSNAAVLKTVVPRGTGGSNPSSSAEQLRATAYGNRFLLLPYAVALALWGSGIPAVAGAYDEIKSSYYKMKTIAAIKHMLETEAKYQSLHYLMKGFYPEMSTYAYRI